MNPMLITMQGPDKLKLSDLSNFEAGVLTLATVDRLSPGITFGQLPEFAARLQSIDGNRMGFSFSDIGDYVSNRISDPLKDVKSVGSVVGDALAKVGDGAGSAVRLVTDKKVVDGLNSSYESFTKSGGIRGAVVGSFASGNDSGSMSDYAGSIWDLITQTGASAKANPPAGEGIMGFISELNYTLPGGLAPWAIGTGVLVFFALKGHRHHV